MTEDEMMVIVNRNYERARRNREIQESIDMANRPGIQKRMQAELAAEKKKTKKAEQINMTLLNWIFLLITIALIFCMSLTWLVLKGLLPQ